MRLAQALMYNMETCIARCISGPADSVADDVVAYLAMGETLYVFDLLTNNGHGA